MRFCNPHGPVVRIFGFHPSGPGSIPGVGIFRGRAKAASIFLWQSEATMYLGFHPFLMIKSSIIRSHTECVALYSIMEGLILYVVVFNPTRRTIKNRTP